MPAVAGEGEGALIEGGKARFGDGPCGEFLAGAGRACDESGEFAHAREQSAAEAVHIVGEDGLPDGGAQARGGHGAADNVAEDELESALNLAEAGKGVPGVVAGREANTLNAEEVAPVGEEAVVETPAAWGVGGGAEAGVIKVSVITGVEKIEDGVLVQHQIRLACAGGLGEAGAELFRDGFELDEDAPDILAWLGLLDAVAPDRFAFDKLGAQRDAFPFDALRQEGIAIAKPGDGPQQGALAGGEKRHLFINCIGIIR